MAADTTGLREKGRTAADDFPEFPQMPIAIKQAAVEFYGKWQEFTSKRGSSDGDQRSISHIASSVYIVLKSQQHKSPSLMSLRELLDSVGTTVFDFFRETTLILQTAAKELWFQALFDSPDCVLSLEKDFKQMEANFIILVILHTKFLKVAKEVFSSVNAETEKQRTLLRLEGSWALFLYVREEEQCFDLIPGFYLLIACLYHAICGAPQLLALDVIPNVRVKLDSTDRSMIIERICQMQSYNQPQAAEQLRTVLRLIDRVKALVNGPDQKLQGDQNLEGCGILVDELLQENVASLKALAALGPRIHPLRDIDGLIVWESRQSVGDVSKSAESSRRTEPGSPQLKKQMNPAFSPHRMIMPAPSPRAAMSPSIPRNPSTFRTPDRPNSLARPQLPLTPMTAALQEHAWLASYISGESADPDIALARYLNECSPNPSSTIVKRAQELPQRLVDPTSGRSISSDLADVGRKLYFKSLRSILQKEEERLRRLDFTDLLNDEPMHRALMAICFEIVIQTHLSRTVPFAFPAVLRAFEVNEYEFLVMTENFLRDFESHLPRDVGKHILQLLKRIVDCDAWRCSSLLSILANEDMSCHFADAIDSFQTSSVQYAPHNHPPTCTSESAGSDMSASALNKIAESPLIVRAPRPPRHNLHGSTAAASVSKSDSSVAAISQSISSGSAAQGPVGGSLCAAEVEKRQVQKQVMAFGRRFWHRVVDVMGTLYRALKTSVGMSRGALERSIRVIKTIVSTPSMRELLHHRHLHQIIMCVIFGSCKAEKNEEVTFKRIIQEHKFNYDPNEQLYWSVMIGPTVDQTGNIIEFYNKKFIPMCKQVLLDDVPMQSTHADPGDSVDASLSPVRMGGVATPASPCTPKRYARNITYGMTPMTSRLYTYESTGISEMDAESQSRKRFHSQMASGGSDDSQGPASRIASYFNVRASQLPSLPRPHAAPHPPSSSAAAFGVPPPNSSSLAALGAVAAAAAAAMQLPCPDPADADTRPATSRPATSSVSAATLSTDTLAYLTTVSSSSKASSSASSTSVGNP